MYYSLKSSLFNQCAVLFPQQNCHDKLLSICSELVLPSYLAVAVFQIVIVIVSIKSISASDEGGNDKLNRDTMNH